VIEINFSPQLAVPENVECLKPQRSPFPCFGIERLYAV